LPQHTYKYRTRISSVWSSVPIESNRSTTKGEFEHPKFQTHLKYHDRISCAAHFSFSSLDDRLTMHNNWTDGTIHHTPGSIGTTQTCVYTCVYVNIYVHTHRLHYTHTTVLASPVHLYMIVQLHPDNKTNTTPELMDPFTCLVVSPANFNISTFLLKSASPPCTLYNGKAETTHQGQTTPRPGRAGREEANFKCFKIIASFAYFHDCILYIIVRSYRAMCGTPLS